MNKKNILVVDDEDSILLSLEFQLGEKGFDVDTAESGEEAIEKLDRGIPYDMVITDLRMYGISGVDVFKRVKEINTKIPVLIITGFGGESPMFKEAMQLKPCGHMFKPFSEEECLEKVNTCLENHN